MGWLPEEEQEEWDQDLLVAKMRGRLKVKLSEAVRRLRTQARSASLDEVRRAEQRVTDLEEFLVDFGGSE
jgi:hypothetical protein